MAFFFGNDGNNLIDGSANNDFMAGNAGNDTLTANAGNDILEGDAGNDLLDGGFGDDTISGGNGNDILEGAQGNDTMIGGNGDDTLAWDDGDGSDRMIGNAGYDTIEFNGAVEKGDELTLKQQGNLAIFDRVNLVPIKLTVDSAEKFDVSGLGGDDKFTVGNLANTGVKLVDFSGDAGNDTLDGSGTSTKIVADGGTGNDVLTSGSANDSLSGGAGNDSLDGGLGDDTLSGGAGNDLLEGAKGNDTVIGGAGDDTLAWDDGDGSDRMSGNAGYDTIEFNGAVEKGDELTLKQQGNLAIFDRVNLVPIKLTVDSAEKFDVSGLGGDDKFTVGNLANTGVKVVDFSGGAGNDTLNGSGTSTKLVANGDAGNDVLIGGSANDTLSGGAGNDEIEGKKGDDRMIGGAGDDTLEWDDGDGNDRISGNAGYDTVEVNGSVAKGDDFVLNQQGNLAIFDRVNLGPFKLTVDSSEKFDVSGLGGDDKFTVNNLSNTDVKLVEFSGGAGNDTLNGSGTSTKLVANGDLGDDLLIGGSANDILSGGAGNDTLKGGGGNDTLTGGAGSDRFVFNTGVAFNAAIGIDQISGFEKSGSSLDKIVLDKSTFSFLKSTAGNGFSIASEFTTVGSDALASGTGAKIIYNSANGNLFYDTNGAGAGFGAGGQFASLDPATNLAASDFIVRA
jgi:Ca2+-binding RTX toxin-like protein